MTKAEAARKREVELIKGVNDGLKDRKGEWTFDEISYFNQATLKEIIGPEIRNAFFNHFWVYKDCFRDDAYSTSKVLSRIRSEVRTYLRWKFGRRDGWGQNLLQYHNVEKGPAIVCGSGPSLDYFYKNIAENWEGGLVTSTSQYSTFRYYGGKKVDYMVGFDWKDTPAKYAAETHTYDHTKFCVMPVQSPELIQAWKGRRVYFRVFDPYVRWHSEVLPIAYGDVAPVHILPFSCSIAAELQIAKYVGYDPIYTFGCDLGPVGLKTYQNQAHWVDKKWVWSDPKDISRDSMSDHWGLLHKNYAEAVVSCLWLDANNVIDCSMGLLNDPLPTASGDDVIKQQGKGFEHLYATPDEIRARLTPWMVGRGAYWVPIQEEDGSDSWKLVRCDPKEWHIQLPMFISAMADRTIEIDMDGAMQEVLAALEVYKKTGGLWKEQ